MPDHFGSVIWDMRGKSINSHLGRALMAAIKARNAGVCAILAPGVAWLNSQEGANYWGTKGRWNYNSLGELVVEAIKVAQEEGHSSFLHDGVVEAERIARSLDWYEF